MSAIFAVVHTTCESTSRTTDIYSVWDDETNEVPNWDCKKNREKQGVEKHEVKTALTISTNLTDAQ